MIEKAPYRRRVGRPKGSRNKSTDPADFEHVTFPPGSRMATACWEGRCDECSCEAADCACLHHRLDRLTKLFLQRESRL